MLIGKARVRSPANIALVKYMGKRPGNIPENASISLTLNECCTGIDLTIDRSNGTSEFTVAWDPAELPAFSVERPWLAGNWAQSDREKAHQRMQKGIEFLARELGSPVNGSWTIRSANTFPAGTGIASSASFFSGLTLAVATALGKRDLGTDALAGLSRQLSGSSCRSFQGPFVEWTERGISTVASALPPLADCVVILEDRHKAVSSSEAHQRVKTSPQWAGRAQRSDGRCRETRQALKLGNWEDIRELAWQDFQDMHALFHTSEPPFSYQTAQTHEVLQWSREQQWIITTMDAGANVHLLVRGADLDALQTALKKAFGTGLRTLVDTQGYGPTVL